MIIVSTILMDQIQNIAAHLIKSLAETTMLIESSTGLKSYSG